MKQSAAPPNNTDPAVLAARAVLAEAAQRPWLASIILRRPASWLGRLAQTVRALPRPFLRALPHRLASGLAVALLAVSLTAPPRVAHAATISVDGTTCTLANAITAANNGSTVGGCIGSAGPDTLNITDNLSVGALPAITSVMTIDGNGHTITGNGLYRVFDVTAAGNLTLKNATITGGRATTSVDAGNGGGIRNAGTLSVMDSTITANYAESIGGGIASSGPMTILNTTISSNAVSADGGGLAVGNASSTITNATISGNQAINGNGGALTFYGNGDQRLSVAFSTITNNTSGGGAAIYGWEGGYIYFSNSIVIAAGGQSCSPANEVVFKSDGYNIDSAEDCNFNVAGDHQLVNGATVLAATLANNGINPHPFTHALIPGSIAIDMIPDGAPGCSANVTLDERGGVRKSVAGGGAEDCDAGAYEYEAVSVSAVTQKGVQAASGGPGAGLLAAAAAGAAALGALWLGLRRKVLRE